jgi:hypothetical protein
LVQPRVDTIKRSTPEQRTGAKSKGVPIVTTSSREKSSLAQSPYLDIRVHKRVRPVSLIRRRLRNEAKKMG